MLETERETQPVGKCVPRLPGAGEISREVFFQLLGYV